MVSVKQAVVLALTSAASVAGFWRMECQGRVGLARIDPLVSPGGPAQHLHSIHGSSGFGLNSDWNALMGGQCTSCRVTQDKSAYWHPSLLFQDDATGKFELVEQVGGMLAYYLLYGTNIKAFPAGFRMIAGDSTRRSYTVGDPFLPDPEKSLWGLLGQVDQATLAQRAVGFNCLNYKRNPEGSLFRHVMPDKAFLDANCADGIRLELMFPSCWNGKDLESPNHKSHMAYPNLVMNGDCPPDFSTRVPSLFYEVIWNTAAYKNRAGRFVFSNGDTTGYGYHGDYIMGWDPAFLQSAVDQCTSDSGQIEKCPLFNIVDENTARQCQMTVPDIIANEDVKGPMPNLPGNVKITGPGASADTNDSPAPPPSPPSPPPSTPNSSPDTPPYPGGVFITSDTAVPAPAPTPDEPVKVADVNTEVPAVTPAPAAPVNDSQSFYSTQFVTVGSIVSEIFWVEEIAYVTEYEDITTTMTVSATAMKKVKRDGEAHLHRHAAHHHGRRS